jgi:hypothetical protein
VQVVVVQARKQCAAAGQDALLVGSGRQPLARPSDLGDHGTTRTHVDVSTFDLGIDDEQRHTVIVPGLDG